MALGLTQPLTEIITIYFVDFIQYIFMLSRKSESEQRKLARLQRVQMISFDVQVCKYSQSSNLHTFYLRVIRTKCMK
jgi:hypothetical protein